MHCTADVLGRSIFIGHIANIDTAFAVLELLTSLNPGTQNMYFVDYWQKNQSGVTIFDARIGFHLSEQIKLSLVVNNVLNKEFALRPMKIERPRTSAVQCIFKF